MQNTNYIIYKYEKLLQKKYETNLLPDGSLVIEVVDSRLGALNRGNHNVVFFIAVLGLVWIGPYLGGWVIFLILAIIFHVIYFFVPCKSVIALLPDGIKFWGRKKQLAIRDIKSIGVMTETLKTGLKINESAYVYADALGNRIPLTRNMTQELAQAIQGEITRYYGDYFR